jgi:hypothetical protein
LWWVVCCYKDVEILVFHKPVGKLFNAGLIKMAALRVLGHKMPFWAHNFIFYYLKELNFLKNS